MIATFVFYNKASQGQDWLAFSKEFKHCNVIVYDGEFTVLMEFVKHGIIPRVYKLNNVDDIIKRLKRQSTVVAIVSTHVTERRSFMWSPLWIKSCNEFNRYISAVDIGMTFNPRHLYKKLVKYNGHSNFTIDYHWRRESQNGNVRRRWWRQWNVRTPGSTTKRS